MGLLNRRTRGAESTQKAEKDIAVINRLGLHARPAAMFVRIASRYRSDVWVAKEGEEVNGKSIMGVLMLVASKGTTVVLRAKGERAAEAIAEIAKLIDDKFGEGA